ncbi:MAG: outer membrane beta-barrel protein [Verrucomicrobiales bacterium]|nr:hypothetical protein [Verrucomicrobiales bacterium]
MKKLLSLIAILAFAGVANAGDKYVVECKNPPVPTGCSCFDPGFELGAYFGASFSDKDGDELGGGVTASYFFTQNLGVELNYGVFAYESQHHVINANVVYRMPIPDLCIAPYVMVGGGLLTNSATDGLFDVGGGIEARFDSLGCIGIFVDATYNWVEDDRDFTLVRGGVRFPF